MIKEVTFEDVLVCYFQHVPCIFHGCNKDISWLGIQHGCISGHSCEDCLLRWVSVVEQELKSFGFLKCTKCDARFTSMDAYFRAVKV